MDTLASASRPADQDALDPPGGLLFEMLATIRIFEETLLAQFQKRGMTGTTHTCIGQEAIAVSAMLQCRENDVVFSNHRSHGHFIAYGGTTAELLHEIAGHEAGVCQGLGGSQHLHLRNFYSNGILGGTIAVCAGMAFAEKLKQSGGIGFCFAGDGVFGEGLVYETLNLISLWSIPLLIVVEDNGYAQTTPQALNRAGTLADRAKAFGIETAETDSNDIAVLKDVLRKAADHVRGTCRPFVQVVRTYRLSPHSKGDDFRAAEELDAAREKDPLRPAARLTNGRSASIEDSLRQTIAAEFDSILGGAYGPVDMGELPDDAHLVPAGRYNEHGFFLSETDGKTKLLDHLNACFARLLRHRDDIYLIGEDLLDPYGGAFKVYRGLSSEFPDRILTSPISEAGIVGLANGMAVRGLRPIVEIMFGDFLGLTMDQLLNHATKFPRMYGSGVRCPVVVRTPMGGRRGYGPTHSQSIEKLFMGITGLLVIAASTVHDQGLIWNRVMELGTPTLYLENKTQYGAEMLPRRGDRVRDFFTRSSQSFFPTLLFQLTPLDTKPDCVLVTYGGGVEIAFEAARAAFVADEIFVRVVILAQVAPLPLVDILNAMDGCRRVVVLEEGTKRWGFGAEFVAALAEQGGGLDWHIRRCAAHDTIIPNAASLEKSVLPQVAGVLAAVTDVAAAS